MFAKEKLIRLKIDNYSVSILLTIPENFKRALIIANGAGSNMFSDFQKKYAVLFSEKDISVIRFNFHYQEVGRKIPDKNEKCQETYQAVIDYLAKNFIAENDIVIGGKSMGGRIATQIAAIVNCPKIVVFGYPLHPPGKPEIRRDFHLNAITQQVLILQGEKDVFGNKAEMEPVVDKMLNTRIIIIPGGDHSLKVAKNSGLHNSEIQQMIVEEVSGFVKQ